MFCVLLKEVTFYDQNRGVFMDFLKRVGSRVNQLTEVGMGVIDLLVGLEVLFNGVGIPFWPDISVVGNIMGIVGSLSNEGLLGLVGAFVLYHILKDRRG